jgi:hypothetical protein
MAPLMDDSPSRRRLPPIEEETELSLVGSIEVESVENDQGKYFERIVYLPPENEGEGVELDIEPSLDEEGIEVSESTTDSLLDTLLYQCVGCEPCQTACQSALPPGILRKKSAYEQNEDRHLAATTHPLQDRVVSFSQLEIREFNMTLGDHPSATSGPPVMLDWDSQPTQRSVSLDEYEMTRSPRRKRKQLKLSYKDRKGILEESGAFSPEEVNQAWAEALRIRQQRQETLKRGLLLMALDDMWESVNRKYRRTLESIGLV